MKILVLFGQPGAGKTYVGKILEKEFGFYLYDGDQDMTQVYKDAIVAETVTDEMRQEFFSKLITNIKKLQHEKIVVSQTFIKEKYRKQFQDVFPNAKFILLQTSTDLREKRLLHRDRFELPLEKWRKMASIFEAPEINHTIIYNDKDGEGEIKEQLQLLLK